MSVQELLENAMRLSEEERAALAHQLLLSLRLEGSADEATWERAWAEEAAGRLGSYKRGESTAREWRDVLAEVERRHRKPSA